MLFKKEKEKTGSLVQRNPIPRKKSYELARRVHSRDYQAAVRIDADCRRGLNRADGGGVATSAAHGHAALPPSPPPEGGGKRRGGKFTKRETVGVDYLLRFGPPS